MDGGDMTCFLGEVLEGETVTEGVPLWWPDARREIPSSWNEEWDRKISEEIQYSIPLMRRIDYTPWEPGG
jgi:hypothetical protein